MLLEKGELVEVLEALDCGHDLTQNATHCGSGRHNHNLSQPQPQLRRRKTVNKKQHPPSPTSAWTWACRTCTSSILTRAKNERGNVDRSFSLTFGDIRVDVGQTFICLIGSFKSFMTTANASGSETPRRQPPPQTPTKRERFFRFYFWCCRPRQSRNQCWLVPRCCGHTKTDRDRRGKAMPSSGRLVTR